MLRSIPILLVTLVVPALALAQAPTSDLRGSVRDASGQPLIDMPVELVELGRTVRTGSEGGFHFPTVPAGTYTVRFHVSDGAVEERSVRLAGREPARLDVDLSAGGLWVMPEIQATATRSDREEFEVPQAISIMGRRELERRQAVKPTGLFATEPGLDVDGAGPFLGLPVIRGLSGNRVLVLVDGKRLNNAREAINFGGVQPGLVDVGEIEQIDVVRGPASVLYGSDAIGGIVNIVTRKPPVPEQGTRVGFQLRPHVASVDNHRAVRGEFDVASPKVGLRVSASVRETDDFDAPDGEVVNSEAETNQVAAELEIRPSAGHTIRLEGDRFRGEDIGLPGTGGVFTGSFPTSDRDAFTVAYENRGRIPGVANLQASVWIQNQEEDFATFLDLPPIMAGPFDLLIDTETSRVSDVTTTGFDIQATSPLAGGSHWLTYGIEWFRDDVEEDRREVQVREFVPRSPGPPGRTETEVDDAPTTPESTFQGFGVYLQDEIELRRWSIVPGVRYDRFDIDSDPLERPEGDVAPEDRSEDAVSASLGILFRATDAIHPFVNVGRAFRTPNIIERFFFGPGSQGGLTVPNPDLDNETSVNVDIGVKVRTDRLRGGFTFFRNEIDDFITFEATTFMGDSTFAGQPVSRVENVGEARIQGFEAELEYAFSLPGSALSLFGNLSYQDGENETEDQPIFVAPLKGVFGARWSDAGGIGWAQVVSRFVGRQDEVPPGFDETAGFGVVGVHAGVSLARWVGQDLGVTFGIENLTDKAFSEPFTSAPAPGRNFSLSLDLGTSWRSVR